MFVQNLHKVVDQLVDGQLILRETQKFWILERRTANVSEILQPHLAVRHSHHDDQGSILPVH